MYELHARLGKWKPAMTEMGPNDTIGVILGPRYAFSFLFLRFFNILTSNNLYFI